MPNVVGLEFPAAQLALQAAGVLVPSSIGYFGTYPVSALWQKSASPPSTVLAQSIASGNTVSANAPVTLSLSQYPIAVVYP